VEVTPLGQQKKLPNIDSYLRSRKDAGLETVNDELAFKLKSRDVRDDKT